MGDEREFFEKLVYHSTQGRRFTQQSPVMPDVWIHYGMEPGKQHELLMEPNWHFTPADLAAALSDRLALDKATAFRAYRSGKAQGPAIACNQNVVAVRLWFDQLVRAALPLSGWWKNSVAKLSIDDPDDREDELSTRLKDTSFEGALVHGLGEGVHSEIPPDVLWLARVAGLIAHISTTAGRKQMSGTRLPQQRVKYLKGVLDNHKIVAKAFIKLLDGLEGLAPGDPLPLYSVNRNRTTTLSLYASVNAIKADAARVVFTTKGADVAWAVVDSGIDARHFAFRKYRREGGVETPYEEAFPPEQRRRRLRTATTVAASRNNTRIVATYDFIHVRELLGAEPEDVDGLRRDWFPALKVDTNRDTLRELLKEQNSFVVDWERLEPFLKIPHDDITYAAPKNQHGTHVAGIVGADWRAPKAGQTHVGPPLEQDMCGVAPAISLYDFRVLDENGGGSEFAIMSALQFIRDLNNRRDFVAIHGVNLSFSIPHDVANYACGRTPVCEEAERLVGSGVVVVAAAGNSGRARYVTPSGTDDEGFRTVSITDPGNAASVITVGSTHRSDAHTYGVSYFSSRGPTGDGRLKPDLVAPGEKIRSCVPGNEDALLDGTSMAAPHVSGAAALLISRHREFVGQPQRIKQILCATATDLGRERYFQGAGLLDILRALQSV